MQSETNYTRKRTSRDRALKRGFTLVEIMIVVVIIGLLAGLALPAIKRMISSSKAGMFANDMKKLTDALIAYSMEYGEWPLDVNESEVPDYTLSGGGTGATIMRDDLWTSKNPLAGDWDYEGPAGALGVNIGISSRNHVATDQELERIDRVLDDGDLTTGVFQKHNDSWVSYVIE